MLEAEKGVCQGYFERWFFSTMKAMCVRFEYGGCRGNQNNFLTEEDCHRTCSPVRGVVLSLSDTKSINIKEDVLSDS